MLLERRPAAHFFFGRGRNLAPLVGFPPERISWRPPMTSNRDRLSLKDRSADQIRNLQRGGDLSPPDPNHDSGPEGNATMRRVWSQPGDEAYNYRNAKPAAGTKTDNHSDLTARESAPGAVEHRSDPSLSRRDGGSRETRRR
jgi:hypothetical protein